AEVYVRFRGTERLPARLSLRAWGSGFDERNPVIPDRLRKLKLRRRHLHLWPCGRCAVRGPENIGKLTRVECVESGCVRRRETMIEQVEKCRLSGRALFCGDAFGSPAVQCVARRGEDTLGEIRRRVESQPRIRERTVALADRGRIGRLARRHRRSEESQ